MTASRIHRYPVDTGAALSAEFTVLDGTAYFTVIPSAPGGGLSDGGILAQSEAVFDNLERKLAKIGAELASIAQMTIYLVDIGETRAAFNEVYARRMPQGRMPIRCAVGVAALARPDMLVEVSAVAEVPDTEG
ncbi:Putative translation initiation inhibitor [Leucobacter sp. 7(1)]|uniref:RidA family protein n=1 Tax=Leucobacter sp. 7(1) TaxID=1255613 RepID=UPI00097EBD6A|nr:RidA family protein [Leucobacter sp. 7(1)]SJN11595.1 Putative translation initiation inhibitor [Leucobacter sp. 7(1)]